MTLLLVLWMLMNFELSAAYTTLLYVALFLDLLGAMSYYVG